MSPSDISTILDRLGRIEAKLDGQHEALAEIRAEVRKTNGRVTGLETREREDRARLDERALLEEEKRERWGGWFRPVIVGVLVVALSAALVAGLNLDRL